MKPNSLLLKINHTLGMIDFREWLIEFKSTREKIGGFMD